MIIYMLPLFVTYLLGVLNEKANSRLAAQFEYVFIFFVGILYCSGYMTGSDWRFYERIYPAIDWNFALNIPIEKGFYLYTAFFRSLSISFWPYLIFSKFVAFLIITSWIRKNCSNTYFSLLLFLGFNVLFIFVDNPLRFMMAMAIVTSSYNSLKTKRFIPFALIILIAASFHVSSLIMIIFYFVPRVKKQSSLLLLGLYTLILLLFTPELLHSLLRGIMSYLPFGALSLEYYLKNAPKVENAAIGISTIFYYFLFLILIANQKAINTTGKHGQTLFRLAIAWFFVSRITSLLPTFFRISLFLAPVMIVVICTVVQHSKKRFYFATVIFVYILFSSYKTITQSWVYYPYTNYFFVHSLSNKSYEFRSEYNKNIFTERFGIRPK